MSSEQKHTRRSIRLKDYDYASSGAYFVTICTENRLCLFGHIADDAMILSTYGEVVREEWQKTAQLRPYVQLDEYVVMPNHFHGILFIEGKGAIHRATTHPRGFGPLQSASLSSIVGTFKAAVTRRINRQRNTPSHPIWQRNYYEHIIRHERDLDMLRHYIQTNPASWEKDSLFR